MKRAMVLEKCFSTSVSVIRSRIISNPSRESSAVASRAENNRSKASLRNYVRRKAFLRDREFAILVSNTDSETRHPFSRDCFFFPFFSSFQSSLRSKFTSIFFAIIIITMIINSNGRKEEKSSNTRFFHRDNQTKEEGIKKKTKEIG